VSRKQDFPRAWRSAATEGEAGNDLLGVGNAARDALVIVSLVPWEFRGSERSFSTDGRIGV